MASSHPPPFAPHGFSYRPNFYLGHEPDLLISGEYHPNGHHPSPRRSSSASVVSPSVQIEGGAEPSPSDSSSATGATSRTGNGSGNGDLNPDGTKKVNASARACLGCRKLKTRCEGAEDPPCKRCRAGPHECIFVESQRGKRPAKKAPDPSLAEKFRAVEKSLAAVLDSMTSGAPPDQGSLERLKMDLAEGLAADAKDKTQEKETKKGKRRQNSSPSASGSGSGSEAGERKRPRSARSPGFGADGSELSLLRPNGAMDVLADASLAAEIEGRTQVTGLDPTFRLSSITHALEGPDEGAPKAPLAPILTKGIVDVDTAVELFRIFFEDAYIHLPLLDPATSSATAILARSPFLFTVICAVASRFHSDPSLHFKAYAEAHVCFVECVAGGERCLESVQACMILTVWTSAPREGKGEDRPKRAWLYFGMAVRMGLELGLFRPPTFVDKHLAAHGHKSNPWSAPVVGVSDDEQRIAVERERTWLLIFVIDRNMSAVMGRPHQIQDTKALLIPLHPMSLPFDVGVIAHHELQMVVGQVMETFRERIYGLSSASDEMPSPVVMKLFNSRLDDWQQRWCPVPGEPISNILLFAFHSSKLFLNTFPLATMLRTNSAAVSDPESVSSTISSAISMLDLGHSYAEMGILRFCPDYVFLHLLYSAVYLLKVKASNTSFATLVDDEGLKIRINRCIFDCRNANAGAGHANELCAFMLRTLLASWKALGSTGPHEVDPGSSHNPPLGGVSHVHPPPRNAFLATPSGPPSSAPYAFLASPFGGTPGAQTPSGTTASYGYDLSDPLDHFLTDTNFFNSVLVSQGADGFFTWPDGMGSAGEAGGCGEGWEGFLDGEEGM